MDLIIVLVSLEVIASKFLDSYISSHRFSPERPSFFGNILEKMGLQKDEWLSFFCTISMVAVGVYFLQAYFATAAFQLLYIFTALFTVVLNLGMAHTSYFGRKNFITSKILK